MRCFIPVLILAFFAVNAVGSPIVTLTIKERAGVARTNEPVLMGVPLPESLFVDTSVFALKDASGNVIPCEFRIANKWWRDKTSIRWLHLDFQTSINANEKKTVVLHNEPASHAVSGSKLSVTDLGTKIQVTTGPVRFTVKKQNFNLFDEVWVDESGSQAFDASHQVVSTHNKGFSLLSAGTRYYASNDASSTARVERQGPMACVILAEGRLKDASGNAKYYVRTRIYAYNNSKDVRVVFSFENRDPSVSNYIPMHGLNMELPTTLTSANFALGAKGGAKTGTLGSAQEAYLYVGAIDAYTYGGQASGTGNTRIDQSVDMGWAMLQSGSKGVAVHDRWFWQMYPSSVEVNGAGMLNVGLFSHRFTGGSTAYPPRFQNFYNIYSGMGRTHELRFVFFNDDNTDEVRGELAGVNSRLLAVAPPVWYCRATQAFGPLVEKNKTDLFAAAQWSQISTCETSMWNAGLKCIGNTNITLGGKDAYDYLGWGDNPHYLEGLGALMWNGNYYDLPFLTWQHFVRALNFNENYAYQFFEYSYAHTTHIQDLHITHFEPSDGKDGACRYCPPMNHIGQDALEPAVMNQTSHHKTQSMFFEYYLLGEDRALDVALKGVKWIKGFGTSCTSTFEITCYSRRLGHILRTLIEGYKYNFDASCLTILNNNLTALRNTLGGGGIALCNNGGTMIDQRWMVGLMTESLVDAYNMTGNETWAATIKQILDNTPSGLNANVSYSAAFCGRHYNNMTYLARASTLYNSLGNGVSFSHHEKDYCEQGHSVLMSYYYFALPDSVNIQVGVEGPAAPAEDGEAISVYPNPFNPSVKIAVSGQRIADSNIGIAIYNTNGKMVQRLSATSYQLSAGITWNASGLPSGVYYLEAEAGGKRIAKRMVYLR